MKPIKRSLVLIDGFFYRKPYGFGRYADELFNALKSHAPQVDFIVVLPEDTVEDHTPDFPFVKRPRRLFPYWEQMIIPSEARRLGCHVTHHPYNTAAFNFHSTATVVTVHDLFFIDHPVAGSLKDKVYSAYSKAAFNAGTKAANQIVAISAATAERLSEEGSRATVIPNTVDHFIRTQAERNIEAIKRADQAGVPYFVHRGGYEEHRNTPRVIDAFRKARASHPQIRLKVLGAPKGASLWNASADDGIDFLPRLSDEQVADLYRKSIGVVAVALREGFGLPALEAFGFRTAVIASNRQPMREIAGDAALLVDPTNVLEIAEAMRSLLVENCRIDLIARGDSRFQQYGAERFATSYGLVYARAATENV